LHGWLLPGRLGRLLDRLRRSLLWYPLGRRLRRLRRLLHRLLGDRLRGLLGNLLRQCRRRGARERKGEQPDRDE
jgi:hypothetical protein